MCFHTFQPVTDQLEIINGLNGNPNIMCASSSDDLYAFDEGLSGVDSEPFEVNYKDYNMLPLCVERADEVVLTLDKLIKRGKIPRNGIFYKYLKGVLQVYITPSEYSWDPEVIEFF